MASPFAFLILFGYGADGLMVCNRKLLKRGRRKRGRLQVCKRVPHQTGENSRSSAIRRSPFNTIVVGSSTGASRRLQASRGGHDQRTSCGGSPRSTGSICSTNPIESTFATVRHRTIRSKGCLSNKTALAMVYKLTDAAQKSWRRLDGPNQLPKLIQRV
jgi:hypothetical protein